jgi:serine/threonine protein kinase
MGNWGAGWAAFRHVYQENCARSLNSQEFLPHSYLGQPGPRYTVLTGTPPFAAAPLSEMYQNIRDGHYLEPTHLSPSARSLIARLLAPDPAERPSLDHLLQDDFFSQVRIGSPGWAPEDLGFTQIQG